MHSYHKLQLFLLLSCLFQNVRGADIINGNLVSDDSMLFMASLPNTKGEHICGGSLISEDFVLTAAHCERVTSVILGTHHLPSASNDMRYKVKKCKHPSYEIYSKGNDIMLLKLDRKAQGSTVKTVNLPNGPSMYYSCQVAGWGYVSSHSVPVDDLRQVYVSTIDSRTCKRTWGNLLPPNTICAGGMGTGKGFCQCDSGGPLLCNNVAVGVVSFNHGSDCDYRESNRNNHYPNVYTDISKFLPWINGVLAKGDC